MSSCKETVLEDDPELFVKLRGEKTDGLEPGFERARGYSSKDLFETPVAISEIVQARHSPVPLPLDAAKYGRMNALSQWFAHAFF